jgi:CIC family chloride channel protein
VLREVRVGDVVVKNRPYVAFERQTSAADVVRNVAGSAWQDTFPVLSSEGQVVGIITTEILRTIAQEPSIAELAIADDMMVPPALVHDSDDVSSALEILVRQEAREVVVIDDDERIVGFLDETEITRLYHASTHSASA